MPRMFWTWTGVLLALAGPGGVASLSRSVDGPATVGTSAPWLAAFCALVAGVAAIARFGERLRPGRIGFSRTSWRSAPWAIAVALFFVFVYGPLAYAALSRLGLGSFDTGRQPLAALPPWYLALTIVLVASGEEWLYRGYAIERLETLTGHTSAAGALSLLMFGVVHLPLWGTGAALSTLVSGGIFTVLYIRRRDVAALMAAHVLVDLYGLVINPPPL